MTTCDQCTLFPVYNSVTTPNKILKQTVLWSGCNHVYLVAIQRSVIAAVVLPVSKSLSTTYFNIKVTFLHNNCCVHFSDVLFIDVVFRKSVWSGMYKLVTLDIGWPEKLRILGYFWLTVTCTIEKTKHWNEH